MAFFEGGKACLILKKRRCLVCRDHALCGVFLKRGDRLAHIKLDALICKDALDCIGCAQGDDDLGVLGHDDVVFFKLEALGKDLYEARVEGERASFKDHRRLDVETLR